MATEYSNVFILPDGKSVSVKVHCPQYPQSVTGVVWRYNSKKEFELKAGIFGTKIPEVPLGGTSVVDKKLFLVEGAVLHQRDDPPTPYQVVVEVIQDGNVLHRQVPDTGGSGMIGDKNIPFLYRFKLEAKP